MKKILIIGKRGFIGNNLAKYLKKFYNVKHIGFKNLNEFKKKINNFDYVVNTSTNKNYIYNKYDQRFDNDLKISNLIVNNHVIYSFNSVILINL